MRGSRQNPEVVVLRHVWPALAFAAAWLWFPHTQHVIGLPYEYGLLLLIAAVTFFRARVALRRPNAAILKYMPIADAALLMLLIRFTGGIKSDLWLFYYFLLIAGAMDPRPRTIELIAPLVIVS